MKALLVAAMFLRRCAPATWVTCRGSAGRNWVHGPQGPNPRERRLHKVLPSPLIHVLVTFGSKVL